jgi:hypothetical protein
MSHADNDPLKRPARPEDVPLVSPMPRSPILDREEPELAHEQDIEPKDDEASPAKPGA